MAQARGVHLKAAASRSGSGSSRSVQLPPPCPGTHGDPPCSGELPPRAAAAAAAAVDSAPPSLETSSSGASSAGDTDLPSLVVAEAPHYRLVWERWCPAAITLWRLVLMLMVDLTLWCLGWLRTVPPALGIGCSIWAMLLAGWIVFVFAAWVSVPTVSASVETPLSAGNAGFFSHQRFGESLHIAPVFGTARALSRLQKFRFLVTVARACGNTGAIAINFIHSYNAWQPLSYLHAATLCVGWFELPVLCLMLACLLGHLMFLLPWSSRLGGGGMTRSNLFMQHPGLGLLDFSWPMNVSGCALALKALGSWSVLRFLPLAHPAQLLEKVARNRWHGPAIVGVLFAVPVILPVAVVSLVVKVQWVREFDWDQLQEEKHGLAWMLAFYKLFTGRRFLELALFLNALVGITPSRDDIAIDAMLRTARPSDPYFAAGWKRVLGLKLVHKLGFRGFVFFLTLSPDDVARLLQQPASSSLSNPSISTGCSTNPPCTHAGPPERPPLGLASAVV